MGEPPAPSGDTNVVALAPAPEDESVFVPLEDAAVDELTSSTEPAPNDQGTTAPPDAPTATGMSAAIGLAPEESAPAADGGEEPRAEPRSPMDQRAAKQNYTNDVQERAQRWEQMKGRTSPRPPRFNDDDEVDVEGVSMVGLVVKIGLVVLVLGLVGGGSYWLFFTGEPRLKANEVWKEYEADTAAANKKYKGVFVQVTGKVKMFTDPQGNEHTFFEMPEEKWGIEITLPRSQMKGVSEGKTITVRGRFAGRAGDGNLNLSNCTLVKAS
jgi:hypothetical protein